MKRNKTLYDYFGENKAKSMKKDIENKNYDKSVVSSTSDISKHTIPICSNNVSEKIEMREFCDLDIGLYGKKNLC